MAFVAVCGKPEARVGVRVVYRHSVRRARRARPTMAEFFGLNGVGVGPETAAVLPRVGFGSGVGGVVVVAPVVMRQPGADHFEVDVRRVDEDCAEDAPVFVTVLVFDADTLAEDERRKILLRLLSEGLRFFGSVNAVKSDFVLSVEGVEDRDSIPVRDPYDASAQFLLDRVRSARRALLR